MENVGKGGVVPEHHHGARDERAPLNRQCDQKIVGEGGLGLGGLGVGGLGVGGLGGLGGGELGGLELVHAELGVGGLGGLELVHAELGVGGLGGLELVHAETQSGRGALTAEVWSAPLLVPPHVQGVHQSVLEALEVLDSEDCAPEGRVWSVAGRVEHQIERAQLAARAPAVHGRPHHRDVQGERELAQSGDHPQVHG